MMSRYRIDERLAEIREAIDLTQWQVFDRDDVRLLLGEVERLRAELSRRGTAASPEGE
jgi:hypothetical protein